jgi:hypothetical protein
VKAAFSPQQIAVLAKALNQVLNKYGPLSVERKLVVADMLVKLAQENGTIPSVDQLADQAGRLMRL